MLPSLYGQQREFTDGMVRSKEWVLRDRYFLHFPDGGELFSAKKKEKGYLFWHAQTSYRSGGALDNIYRLDNGDIAPSSRSGRAEGDSHICFQFSDAE